MKLFKKLFKEKSIKNIKPKVQDYSHLFETKDYLIDSICKINESFKEILNQKNEYVSQAYFETIFFILLREAKIKVDTEINIFETLQKRYKDLNKKE